MTGAPTILDRIDTCAGCSLLCDDFQDPVQRHQRLCSRGREWLQQLESRPLETQYWLGPKKTTLRDAIARSHQILREAKAPLICGLENLSVQAQSLAVQIAIRCRGFVDSGFGRSMGRLLAFQQVGNVSATLGEIRDRAETIIFLFAEPWQTHPRLWERLRCESKQVVFLGDGCVPPSLGQHIQMYEPKTSAVAVAGRLHQMAAMNEQHLQSIGAVSGSDDAGWNQVIRLLQDDAPIAIMPADVVELPLALQQSYWAHLFHWVQALNRRRRAWLLPLRNDSNGLAAENAMAALTGFPRAVSFQSGYPEFDGMAWSADYLFERGAIDAMLFVDGGHRPDMSEFAGPMIRIQASNIPVDGAGVRDVTITTPLPGAGDWVRIDDVMLPIVQGETTCPVEAFLSRLIESLLEKRSW